MRSILSVVLLLGTTLTGAAGAADGGPSPAGQSGRSPSSAAVVPGQEGASDGGQYAPGNTGQNLEHDTRIEAEDQSNVQADVELTTNIRRALIDDASLSLSAHNVKIITTAGRVTLRGPVNSEAERRKVEAIAKRAAGGRPVVNELEVGKR